MTLRSCFMPAAWALSALSTLAGCSSSDVDLGGPGGQGPKPETYPRLIVAGYDGVRIWDKATSITANTPPQTRLDAPGAALGLGLDGDDLLVASGSSETQPQSALHRFSGASKLVNGAKPASSIPGEVFDGKYQGGSFGDTPVHIQADGRHNLWIHSSIDSGSVHFLPAQATAPTAHFGGLLTDMVYDQTNDKLFASNIELVRSPAWNQAASKTGTIPEHDYQFTQYAPRTLALAGGRLYSNLFHRQASQPEIAIWKDLATANATREPDVIMRNVCGGERPSDLLGVAVAHDVLMATHVTYDEQQRAILKICLFKGAAAIAGDRQPDAVASDPSLKTAYYGRDKAVLTKDGHLFVLDAGGIAIFKDATTAPAFVTRLAYADGQANDFLVLE